jgi:hypothetical protein
MEAQVVDFVMEPRATPIACRMALMPPLSNKKPGGCDRRRAAASSWIIVDRFDAFFRVILHAIDFATNRVRLHQAFIVGP